MQLRRRTLIALLAAAALTPGLTLLADTGQFDLLGPTIEVKVNRGGKTLPIAQVPTLAEGDRIWLHPVLDQHQSVRYLMVAAFLRGSTNPPPEEWFTKADTWDKKVIEEGLYITVPPGAQQAVVFLAPETGGDFSTIKNAVRGRPGSFVRASQDLNVASLDRARIDTYLDTLKHNEDPAQVKDVSTMLARSLSLKVDQQCYDRTTEQQAPCLMQNQDQMILDNGRSTSVTSSLVNGSAGDLALEATDVPQANYGYYNSYVAAAMDIARILDNFHTAQYQYIPALSLDEDVTMRLRLNTPPSFHNPKSVLVIALPPVESQQLPPLHAVDPKQTLCMQRQPLVLPVEGAPSVFATSFGHGLTLHLEGHGGGAGTSSAAAKSGVASKSLDLPVKADAGRGGFAVPVETLANADLGSQVTATVRGFWGFETYTGPTFRLESTDDTDWTVAEADKNALVVGREDELHLSSPSAACVDGVSFKDAQGKEMKADWKLTKPDELTAKLPLKDVQPGEITLEIMQAGTHAPRTLTVNSFSEAGKFESFSLHAGDKAGILKGTRLDEVAKLTLKDMSFTPGALVRSGTTDELTLSSNGSDAKTAKSAPAPGERLSAHITLKDGRHLDVPAAIASRRPQVSVLNKSVQIPPTVGQTAQIHLADVDELPLDGKLTFALKSQTPSVFGRGESIEVATEDGMASVTLSLLSGELVLQDAKTAIATLDPVKSFGNSAFGPLQVRPVMADGTQGGWQKLATLVRLPLLSALSCPSDPAAACTLSGTGLYLMDAVAADPQFTRSITVPDGFAGSTLDVPHSSAGELYVKLRDNPGVVNTLAVDTLTPSKGSHPSKQSAALHPSTAPLGSSSAATRTAAAAHTDPAAAAPSPPANAAPAPTTGTGTPAQREQPDLPADSSTPTAPADAPHECGA